ncbi:hypothetical protein D3C76_361140 [compost metagenome]
MAVSRQAGFTLLEAVVAMTLLVLVGGALLSWLNSGFISLERISAAQQRIEATRTALAYLERINPMINPAGSVVLGPYRLDWNSQALTAPRPVVGRYSGNPGAFDAELFRVEALVHSAGAADVPISLELAGFRLARRGSE